MCEQAKYAVSSVVQDKKIVKGATAMVRLA